MKEMIINNKNLVAINSTTLPGVSRTSKIMQFIFNTKTFMNMSNQMNSEIEELIANFQTRLGYPVNIDVEDVIEYIDLSGELFAVITQLKRGQNAKNLVDVNNKKLGRIFSDWVFAAVPNDGDLYTPSLSNIDITNQYNQIPTGYVVRETPNISNVAWVNLIARANNLIRIPVVHANMFNYYFSNYFSNHTNVDDGLSSLIKISVDYTYVSEGIENELEWAEDLVGKLDTLSKNNPQLMSFLELEMGLANFTEYFDFTRDLRGETVSIIDDQELVFAIETNHLVLYPISEMKYDEGLEHNEVIYSPGDIYYTPFNAPRVGNVNAEDYIHKMVFSQEQDSGAGTIFRSVLSYMLVQSVTTSSTDHTLELAIPPVEFTGTTATIPAGWTNLIERFEMMIPFRLQVTPTDMGADNKSIKSGTVRLWSSFNTFIINEEDFEEVKEFMLLEWLFSTSATHSGINRVAKLGVYVDDDFSQEKSTSTSNKKQRKKKRDNRDK